MKCALLMDRKILNMNPQLNNQDTKTPLMNNFEKPGSSVFSPKFLVVLVIIILLGIFSGYFLTSNKRNTSNGTGTQTSSGSSAGNNTIVGSNDTATFKDTAEGILKSGGIDGEGTYHLVRPGGDSQNVYLTSSIVDLSLFVNKNIKVWGQTQSAQHAGWFMDVGRVEVLQ